MMMKAMSLVLVAMAAAGCSSSASRMADCQAQGISKDACYIAEQNRQASINSAAENAALRNAAAQYAQAAPKYKKVTARIDGIDIKIYPADKQGYIESTAAALIEENADAQVYQKGIFTAIWYKRTHQVALMRDGKFVAKTKI
ncbi:Uncharacterised protein [Ewingella americana]|jgi:hypothetical protein|uniref:Lipoprotein n=3 Tax=Ewingella americana TaxID=41202 RepID=A0A085GBD6_EWIA3|nr:hypothetical protein [Ewingella americana]KFC81031.1 hypothetical protein GEAM_1900 [Ewingella americana ATCC 33852]STQ44397.1 Uncharacterised protein [Ewingella americana]